MCNGFFIRMLSLEYIPAFTNNRICEESIFLEIFLDAYMYDTYRSKINGKICKGKH